MLQAENSRNAGLLVADELPDQQPYPASARHESEGRGPRSRNIPTETKERAAPPPDPQGKGGKGKEDKPRRGIMRRPLALSLGALLLASVAGGGYLYWDDASRSETTDDAFIAARQFSIAPKVAGYLTTVPVTDNQHVAAGEVIARIDDRDYRVAFAQAQAQVAAAQASIGNIDAQIAVQEAQIAQNEAQVQQAQAALTFAQQQAGRYGTLARDGWGTVQDAQQYSSQQRQAQASLQSAGQAVKAATRQLDVLTAQRNVADANLAQATAQRGQAALNLSYTVVTAAQPGRVAQLSAAVGQYAQAGTALTMFVPDDVWVAANFKETQLDRMRPGDKATIQLDAYPERAIVGSVASVQPGSGTAFSLLPAENATGNYVKIVQRVPVKIVLDNPPQDVALGPGMSVEPTVRVDPRPSLWHRLRSWL
jgi:membrane fusion protein (multidrug efflux system)